MSIRKMSM